MEKNFALTPTVSISRSKFLRRSQHKTSIKLGEIVPIYVDEVLPGDTRSISLSSLIRMSTPIAPIMDDIVMEFYAFFVPNRLVWDNWKQFMGESDTAGYDTNPEKIVPTDLVGDDPVICAAGSIADYMGLPPGTADFYGTYVNALPFRSYFAIYNRWFRNQNVEAPIYYATGDLGCDEDPYVVNGNSITDMGNLTPLVAYKKADYFTSCLPYAQKGTPVALPLGTFAPVVTTNDPDKKVTITASTPNLSFGNKTGDTWSDYTAFLGIASDNVTGGPGLYAGQETDSGQVLQIGGQPSDGFVIPNNLIADLSKATAATINDIRLAFATQKALEKDALYGTRYWEILYGHFGVKSPDASLQDPEYLGGQKVYINVDQVLQTTGATGSASSTLGTPGANSVTGSHTNLFTKSFVEHGTLMILAVARQKSHTYGQGINRMWLRSKRFDYYLPVFANLGAQEVKSKELACIDDADENDVFGYQEAWAEYRYKPNIVSGLLNPARNNSLSYWTLADKFSSTPTLGKTFLKESRDNIARALVTGVSGPDFICDFLFDDVAVRPMPLYSVPGLIDHH